jgi:hypothetical protein
MNSNNIIGSTLTRRFQQIGDIVKVGRGVSGLKEWYPNHSFNIERKVGTLMGDDAKVSDPNEPEQLS